MKLRNFLKLMAVALVVPMGFVACSDDDDPVVPVEESVTLSLNEVDLFIGEDSQLTATLSENAVGVLTWTSSNPSVATVDANGKVTAVAPGKTTITAALPSGKSASCEVEVDAENTLLVFNSGSYYSSIDGTLSAIKFEKSQTVTNEVFSNVNGRSLGSTVQDGVVFGDNLYIAVYQSNTIEVVNKYSFKTVTTILPDEATGLPRDIVADDNYVYVSMYTGYVARINPATNTIDKTVQVGPNPEEMVIEDGYLYVANSDGMNYGSGYVNGVSVSKVNLSTFTEEKKIAVGVNPTNMVESNDKIFVVCNGDYTAPTIWVIENDVAKDTGIPASFIAEDDDVLYVIFYPYYEEGTTYTSYSTKTMDALSTQFVQQRLDAPASIAVDDDRIFISSYNIVNGWASYSTEGYVNEYKLDGTFVKKYDVGVGPVKMAFID